MRTARRIMSRSLYLALLMTATSLYANSGEWSLGSGELSVGAAVAVSVSPYKSYDVTVAPLPLITYDSDRFYLKGLGLGVHLLKNERHTVSLGATYHGMGFDPKDTDARELKALDKRHGTLMANV